MARPKLLTRLRSRVAHATSKTRKASAVRSLARHRKAYLTETVTFDGTPTFRGLVLLLAHARRHGWDGRLNSSDRRKSVAEKYGKKSQWALYDGFTRGLPGYNPANPPGFSSHELRSDGGRFFLGIFKRKRGSRLPWYQLGLDVSDPDGLVIELGRIGVSAAKPYKVASEAHHVNLKEDPTNELARLGYV